MKAELIILSLTGIWFAYALYSERKKKKSRYTSITEIWKDRDFITPHLGKLSSVNEPLASELLSRSCFEKLEDR